MLKSRGVDFDAYCINEQPHLRTLLHMAGFSTVPQVFVDGMNIGGLEALERFLDQ